jgi:hypothetical protein
MRVVDLATLLAESIDDTGSDGSSGSPADAALPPRARHEKG